jgi:hypothetical protein
MIPCFVRGVSANAKLGPQPVFVNGNHMAAKRRKRPKVLTAENAENAKNFFFFVVQIVCVLCPFWRP